jgi:hypothetical protein
MEGRDGNYQLVAEEGPEFDPGFLSGRAHAECEIDLSLIEWLTADWVTNNFLAAAVKEPVRASNWNARSWRVSTSVTGSEAED